MIVDILKKDSSSFYENLYYLVWYSRMKIKNLTKLIGKYLFEKLNNLTNYSQVANEPNQFRKIKLLAILSG